MNALERAAFYEEISNRGILVFRHEENEEGTFCAQKVATQADQSLLFEGNIPSGVKSIGAHNCSGVGHFMQDCSCKLLFINRDDAESFVKSYIGWDWKPDEKEKQLQIIQSLAVERFQAFMMFDTGIGPENLDLGEIEASDPTMVMSIAESRARDHFDKYLPKEDLDQTKKSIKFRPIQ